MNWKVLLALLVGLAVCWWWADGHLGRQPVGVSGEAVIAESVLPGAIAGIAVYLLLLGATGLWLRLKR
jgi:hypothetical protein